MKELSIVESLDIVLKEISENSPPGLKDFEIVRNMTAKAYNMFFEGQWANIELIIEKLLADKYIEQKSVISEQNTSIDIYSITFEGRLFLEQNGYAGQKLDKERLTTMAVRQHEIYVKVYWLTVVLAFATAVAALYYSIEILKHFCNQ